MIPLKSKEDLDQLRKAGKITANIIRFLRDQVKEGITTQEINDIALELMHKEKVISAFKNYKGYPAEICTSVNEEIVHGIPSSRKLEKGDIISLDVGINCNGYFSDSAITVAVGKVDPRVKKLIEVTRKSLELGIKQAREGKYLFDISYAIQSHVERNGFSVVREFVGHGVGKSLHEEPEIPNYGLPHRGPLLKNGMVLAIEPMINMGSWESRMRENCWTAVTKDGLPSAHFEHTVAITEKGPEILTH